MRKVRKMFDKFFRQGLQAGRHGQTAVEYLLLLTIAAVVVFVGFQRLLPRVEGTSNQFFNKATQGIMGKPAEPITPAAPATPPLVCGDNKCDPPEQCFTCLVDCGPCPPPPPEDLVPPPPGQ